MGRKKKDGNTAKIKAKRPTLKLSDYRPAEAPYDIAPLSIDTTTLLDEQRRHIPYIDSSLYEAHPYTITTTGTGPYVYPSSTTGMTGGWTTWGAYDVEKIKEKIEKDTVGDVKIDIIKTPNENEFIVACQNKEDLSVDRILKTLSAVKGKLMLEVSPNHIQKIECSITPEVRKNIVQASKKLKMYGKKKPIIARFDDYGRRLPDEIELDTVCGVTLKIVDPEDYLEFYLEMKAIKFPETEGGSTAADYLTGTWIDPEDLPF